tara:strand:- start:402 stop:560 length:159 start_codon:yes stop_codon:yes gene_type:complete
MVDYGYGIVKMGGNGHRMECIPIFSVGMIPHGFIFIEELMGFLGSTMHLQKI